jgi:polysaccharide pyruvyl transferase WcaK-like protein
MARFVILADVGGPHGYHAGDEAMLDANLEGLRNLSPGAELVVCSADPEWTGRRYGVKSVARGTPVEADLAFVSGGGNLCSTWPDLLWERIRALRSAKRSIVVGQTLGPALARDEREALADALRRAALVGVRECGSLALARSMGIREDRLLYQLDDAFHLSGTPAATEPDPYIALTAHPFVEPEASSPELERVARVLTEFSRQAGCRYLFLSHFPDDRRMAQALCARMPRDMISISRSWEARELAGLTRSAEMVVSTRYHPLVFGLSGCVPGVGIYVDEYTRVKLAGALQHGDCESAVPLADVGVEILMSTWSRRQTTRRRLSSKLPHWREMEERKWSRVKALLAS